MKDVKIHYKHKIMMFYNINSVCFSTSIPNCSFCQLDIDSYMARRNRQL